MSVAARQDALIEEYGIIENHHERLGAVVDAARNRPRLSESDRTEDRLVPGCQSRVWLISEYDGTVCRFRSDCDSPLVAGLVALQLAAYDGAKPTDIVATPPRVLAELGLLRDLTPTRRNGLAAVQARLVAFAESVA